MKKRLPGNHPPFRTLSILAVVSMVCACSTTHHRESADREVYSLIAQRATEVPGMESEFTIERTEVSLEGLPVITEENVDDFLGEEGRQAELGAKVLSLEKVLELAVRNSPDYQTRKESMYLQALAFTSTRQRYRPVFGGRASGDFAVDTVDVAKQTSIGKIADATPDMLRQAGALTGSAAALWSAYADVVDAANDVTGVTDTYTAIHQDRSLSGSTSFDVGMLMKGGAEIALSLSSNFLRFVTGDPRVATSSALSASLSKPLLGSDRRAARETLTQAQRDVLYDLRSFARYRKQFSISIASSYYRVLQSRDAVRNNWNNYQVAKRNLERALAEVEAGFITQTALGRTEEDALQAENSWTLSVQSYLDRLDGFKIDLGLRPTDRIVLDDGELSRLLERGLMPPPTYSIEDALEVARVARLDYYTERDQLEDAERQMSLAKDDLFPNISLSGGASVSSEEGDRFQEIDFEHYNWDIGLSLDPKLNRKSVRNNYRSALISYDQAVRSFTQFEDSVKQEVRETWRALEQAAISYQIQKNSVEVGERRVLEQELNREMGEASMIDIIDAQNDLVDARNSFSRAAVDHTLAYLELWLSMGILYIKEDGRWEDMTTRPLPITAVETAAEEQVSETEAQPVAAPEQPEQPEQPQLREDLQDAP